MGQRWCTEEATKSLLQKTLPSCPTHARQRSHAEVFRCEIGAGRTLIHFESSMDQGYIHNSRNKNLVQALIQPNVGLRLLTEQTLFTRVANTYIYLGPPRRRDSVRVGLLQYTQMVRSCCIRQSAIEGTISSYLCLHKGLKRCQILGAEKCLSRLVSDVQYL